MAEEDPAEGLVLELPQVWESGGKSGPFAGSTAWQIGCWVLEMSAKYNVFFSSAVHCFSFCEMARILPFEPYSVEATPVLCGFSGEPLFLPLPSCIV